MDLLEKLDAVEDFHSYTFTKKTKTIVPIKWGYEILKSVTPTVSLFMSDGKVDKKACKRLCGSVEVPSSLLISKLENHNQLPEYFSSIRFNGTSDISQCFINTDDILADHACPICRTSPIFTGHVSSNREWHKKEGCYVVQFHRTVYGRYVKWASKHGTQFELKGDGEIVDYKGKYYTKTRHGRYQYNHEHQHYIPLDNVYVDDNAPVFGYAGVIPNLTYLNLRVVKKYLESTSGYIDFIPAEAHTPFYHPCAQSLMVCSDYLDEDNMFVLFESMIAIFLMNHTNYGSAKPFVVDKEFNVDNIIDFNCNFELGRRIRDSFDSHLHGIVSLAAGLDSMLPKFIGDFHHEYQVALTDKYVVDHTSFYIVITKENYVERGQYYLGDQSLVLVKMSMGKNGHNYCDLPVFKDYRDLYPLINEDIVLVKGLVSQITKKGIHTANTGITYSESVVWFIVPEVTDIFQGWVWVPWLEALDSGSKRLKNTLKFLRDIYIKKYRSDSNPESKEN
jgi:hypothetical protein